MAEYRKYTHVERLGTEECDGLLENDQVFVTAKVDGSNGCVFWNSRAGKVCAGSRNNLLSDAEDNAFFHAWLNSDAREAQLLKTYCEQHPSQVIYGEWMGRDTFVGAFKAYDKAARAKLIIFDVLDEETGEYLPEMEWRAKLAEAGLEPYFVKLLAVLDHPTQDDVLAVAQRNNFLLEGTDYVGEGVVCKVPGWKNKFGRPVYGKIVLADFKKQAKSSASSSEIEPDIISLFVTDAEIEKTMAKICVMVHAEKFDKHNRKMMGMLTSFCWKDLLEECPNWVKKFKNPKVDFGLLSGLCTKRVKEYADNH